VMVNILEIIGNDMVNNEFLLNYMLLNRIGYNEQDHVLQYDDSYDYAVNLNDYYIPPLLSD
ncbi:unnamed protein product, partial [Rotaria socialis]